MLQAEGVAIGRYKVRKLMEESGLICKQPGPHAYKQATVERPDIPNHLDRQFSPDRPDRVWCGDITYIWAGNRWVYLAVVLDLYSRRVVGWAISDRADAILVVKALEMAYLHRHKPSGVMFHSDQGSQYISRLFRQRLPAQIIECDVFNPIAVIEALDTQGVNPSCAFSNSDHLQTVTALVANYFALPGKSWTCCYRAKNKAVMRDNLRKLRLSPKRSLLLRPSREIPESLPPRWSPSFTRGRQPGCPIVPQPRGTDRSRERVPAPLPWSPATAGGLSGRPLFTL